MDSIDETLKKAWELAHRFESADLVPIPPVDCPPSVKSESSAVELRNRARFVDENPNPVLRLDSSGCILYANPASRDLLRSWGTAIGACAPPAWCAVASAALINSRQGTFEAELNERIFAYSVIPVVAMAYVNFYGVDVTEHKRAETERQHLLEAEAEARQEAERANELRLRFLGMISHELRTPLASIKGFTTTLLADDLSWDDVSRREFLTIIDHESDKLTDMIDQLLDLARIESGTLQVDPAPLRIADLMAEVQSQLGIVAGQHPFTVKVVECLPTVRADRQRIAQVLTNLVSNAAKYSLPGTPIDVIVERPEDQSDYVRVTICDQGSGMSLDDREIVFEAFRRGSNATTHRIEGTGLGLAICQGLIRAHGGRIWIDDNTPCGTMISFTLPIEPQCL